MGTREDLTDRLMARTGGLARRTYHGIDVFSGPTAERALSAVQARAFTMDRQIFVGRDFDPEHNSEHASLLLHEHRHAMNSGGEGGASGGHNHDDEEQEARQDEAMVLHLMESGSSLQEVVSAMRQGNSAAANAMGIAKPEELVSRLLIGGERDRDPMAAYTQMRSEGMSHAHIVDDLVREALDTVSRLNGEHNARTGESDFLG
ncbi:MAG: DUF4157 domain-containing protein [Myxococcota bacterium]